MSWSLWEDSESLKDTLKDFLKKMLKDSLENFLMSSFKESSNNFLNNSLNIILIHSLKDFLKFSQKNSQRSHLEHNNPNFVLGPTPTLCRLFYGKRGDDRLGSDKNELWKKMKKFMKNFGKIIRINLWDVPWEFPKVFFEELPGELPIVSLEGALRNSEEDSLK